MLALLFMARGLHLSKNLRWTWAGCSLATIDSVGRVWAYTEAPFTLGGIKGAIMLALGVAFRLALTVKQGKFCVYFDTE